jgi:hypothetical protein
MKNDVIDRPRRVELPCRRPYPSLAVCILPLLVLSRKRPLIKVLSLLHRRKIARGDRKFWIDDLEDRTANPESHLAQRQSTSIEPQPVMEKRDSDSADETHEKDSVKNITSAHDIHVV